MFAEEDRRLNMSWVSEPIAARISVPSADTLFCVPYISHDLVRSTGEARSPTARNESYVMVDVPFWTRESSRICTTYIHMSHAWEVDVSSASMRVSCT